MTCSDARDPKYWRQNLEKPVLFSQAISLALEEQEYYVIEIGPHSTFKIAMMDIAAGLSREVQYSPTVIRGLEPVMTIMQLTGSMFLHGLEAPIKKINGTSSPFASGTTPSVVTNLPPYPWKRGPVLWNEGRLSSEYLHRIFPRHDLLGSGVVGGSKNVHTWRNVLNLRYVLWLHDHKLKDTFVFPAAGYLAMIIEAFKQIMASRGIMLTSVTLRDIKFLTMLTFDDEDTSIELFTELCPTQNSLVHPEEDKFCFTISSFASNTSTIHCRGIVEMGADARRASTRWSHLNATTTIPKVAWYNTLRKEGLNFGDAFQLLDDIKHPTDQGAMEVLCTCNPPSYSPHTSLYPVHPTVIDSLFQAAIISTTSGRCNALKGKIPVSIDTFEMTMDIAYVMGKVRARSSFGSQHTAICDAEMFDIGMLIHAAGNKARISGIDLSPLSLQTPQIRAHYTKPLIVGPLQEEIMRFSTPVDHIVCFGALHFLNSTEFIATLVRMFMLARKSVAFDVDDVSQEYIDKIVARFGEGLRNHNNTLALRRFGVPSGWRKVVEQEGSLFYSPSVQIDVRGLMLRFEKD